MYMTYTQGNDIMLLVGPVYHRIHTEDKCKICSKQIQQITKD